MNPKPKNEHSTRPRVHRTTRALSGLALVLMVSGMSGCSDGSGAAKAQPGTDGAAAAAGAGVTGSAAAPAPTATTVTIIDPNQLLAQSLASTSVSYDFTTVVAVDGVEATRIGGRAVGQAVAATIDSTAGSLEYVSSADGRFVRSIGEDWSVLTEPVVGASSTGPLAGLGAPLSVGTISSLGVNGAVLTASYPPAALGLSDGDPLTVEITVSNGLLSAINYVTTISGQTVTVHSAIAPATSSTPITSPVLLEAA